MNRDYEKQVGNRIRALREEAGLTQDMFAARLQTMGCDITRSALAKIEVAQRHLYPDELRCIKIILKAKYGDILE